MYRGEQRAFFEISTQRNNNYLKLADDFDRHQHDVGKEVKEIHSDVVKRQMAQDMAIKKIEKYK